MTKSQRVLRDRLWSMILDSPGFCTPAERHFIGSLCSRWHDRHRLRTRTFIILKSIGQRRLGTTHPLITALRRSAPPKPIREHTDF